MVCVCEVVAADGLGGTGEGCRGVIMHQWCGWVQVVAMGPLMCSSGQGGGCEVVASGSSGVEFLVVWLWWLEASHVSH